MRFDGQVESSLFERQHGLLGAVPRSFGEHQNRVIAGPTSQAVIASTTNERVVARTTKKRVITRATRQRVGKG